MATMNDAETAVKRKVIRSPNYPALSLKEAIERVRQVYEAEKRTPASADTILAHLGYKPGAGPGYRVLSALRHYGLLEEYSGQDRVSDSAFHILTLSETSPDRLTALSEAARQPTLFRQVLDHYKDQLPSDLNLRDYLIKTHKFNPDSVGAFVKALRETFELAKLGIVRDNQASLSDAEQPEMSEDSAQSTIVVRQQPFASQKSAGRIERLIDDSGLEITLEFQNEPSIETYEYLRDYLDFKLQRMSRKNAQTKAEHQHDDGGEGA